LNIKNGSGWVEVIFKCTNRPSKALLKD